MQLGSTGGVKCDVSLKAGFYRKSYALELRLISDKQTLYKNDVFIAPNQWQIHECGVSVSDKREVLAIKVDHVNYYGESIYFPAKVLTELNFNAGLVSGDSENPFTIRNIYKAYKVPMDMFDMLSMKLGKPLNMKDVTKILRLHIPEIEGFFFRSRRLLIARGNDRGHKDLRELLANISIRQPPATLAAAAR